MEGAAGCGERDASDGLRASSAPKTPAFGSLSMKYVDGPEAPSKVSFKSVRTASAMAGSVEILGTVDMQAPFERLPPRPTSVRKGCRLSVAFPFGFRRDYL